MKFKSFKIVQICLMIKIKILNKNLLYCNFILQPLFQSAQHFNEKRERFELVTEGSGSGFRIRIRIRMDPY